MGLPQNAGAKGVLQSPLRRQRKAVGHLRVIGEQAQQAGHQGLRRTVALPRGGKGAVEQNFRFGRLLPQQGPGQLPDPNRPRRVGAGGAHHHRAEDVKQIHGGSFLCGRMGTSAPTGRNPRCSRRLSAWRTRFACSRRAASLRLGLVSAACGRPPSPSLRSIRAVRDGSALMRYPPEPNIYTRSRQYGSFAPSGRPPAAGRTSGPSWRHPRA